MINQKGLQKNISLAKENINSIIMQKDILLDDKVKCIQEIIDGAYIDMIKHLEESRENQMNIFDNSPELMLIKLMIEDIKTRNNPINHDAKQVKRFEKMLLMGVIGNSVLAPAFKEEIEALKTLEGDC